jgi:glutaminyl-peptide cyclotransferase
MATLESRLRSLSCLRSKPQSPFFPDTNKNSQEFHVGGIEDDHIPFLRRGVEVLHIIPIPFPNVWHTMNDDGEHLDMDTSTDWAKIVTAFVAEWMDLEGYLPAFSDTAKEKRAKLASKTEL